VKKIFVVLAVLLSVALLCGNVEGRDRWFGFIYNPAQNPEHGWVSQNPFIQNPYYPVPVRIWDNLNTLFVRYGHMDWVTNAPPYAWGW